MKKSQTNLTVPQEDNNQITFLPSEKIVSEHSISSMKAIIKILPEKDTQYYRSSIPFLDNLDYIGEIILFCINRVAALKKAEERAIKEKLIEEMMGEVFGKFEHLEYSNHKLFRNYKVLKTKDPKKFIYKIPSLDLDNRMRECIIGEKESTNSIDKFEKIKAINAALTPSLANDNIKNAANIIKDLLENSKEILDLFSQEPAKYQHTLKIIISAIQCIEPKFQLKPVIVLKEHLKENPVALLHASKVLMDNEFYEKAIELLEPKLLNITSADKLIANCMYNLGLSYMELGKFTKAEQYFLAILRGGFADEETINNLWFIYTATDRVEAAKELLPNFSSESNKTLHSLSLDIQKINNKSLKLINKNNKKTLPDSFSKFYKCYEYISKYNGYSNIEKNENQKKLYDELKRIIDSTKLNKLSQLSVALYTKQNEIALDILKEMPKGFFETFPNLIRLKALLDPNSILSLQEKYGNIDNEENKVIFNIACNSLIIENRCELLTKAIEAQKKNGGISDELLFEVKFVIALLEGKKAEAKEYIEQLSEEKQKEIISNFSSNDEQIDSLEQFIEQCDAKKIHEYYQTKKKHDLLLMREQVTKTPIGAWKLEGGETITTEKAKFIGKFQGKNCYGVISEKLEAKVGSFKFNMFKKTLEEKGLIYRKFGQNGVKFLKKAFEVKIDDNERVYTNHISVNDEGELLLNFDNNGNHNEVESFVSGHNLVWPDFV